MVLPQTPKVTLLVHEHQECCCRWPMFFSKKLLKSHAVDCLLKAKGCKTNHVVNSLVDISTGDVNVFQQNVELLNSRKQKTPW